jgi:NADH-quinone oxidoreductase subunit J
MISTYIFLFLSFLALLCALMVVFSKNPVHSVLYLVLTFFAIAGHYILMNAQFLAVVHIVVYAGAIMVLFLFVIMLLNMNDDTEPQKNNFIKFAAVISGGIFLVTMVGSLKGAEQMAAVNKVSQIGIIKNLGVVLFKEFLLPFELSSVLLLAAMVGAVYMGKKELTNKEEVK